MRILYLTILDGIETAVMWFLTKIEHKQLGGSSTYRANMHLKVMQTKVKVRFTSIMTTLNLYIC